MSASGSPGGPLLRRCSLASLVSWRMRRSEVATRTRARSAMRMVSERDNRTACVSAQFHHTAIAAAEAEAAAAAAAAAARCEASAV